MLCCNTSRRGTETKAGIGLTVGVLLELDIGRKSTENAGPESRIKFKVPMFYPMHRYPSIKADVAPSITV